MIQPHEKSRFKFNGREVQVVALERNDDGSWFATDAYYADTLNDLNHEELENFNEQMQKDGWQ